jgi:hypothetical protein
LASPFCPYEEPRALPRAVDLDLTPRGRVKTFDASQSPFGSLPPTIYRPCWLRKAVRAVSSLPETSAETPHDPWPVTGFRRTLPQAASPHRRPEEHQHRADARPRRASRGTAAAPWRCAMPRRTRHLTIEHHLAPRGTHRQTHRPRCDPKITLAPRDTSAIRRPPRHPASLRPSPRTPSHPPSTPHCPEGHRSEGGTCVETLRTDLRATPSPRRPRKVTEGARRSPHSPRSSSTPTTHRAACLRRDPTRSQCPARSSVGARSLRAHRLSAPKSLETVQAVTITLPVRPTGPPEPSPPDPERTGGVPWRPSWSREDAVPNVRAASWLRRALQQGAERSERPHLSPSRLPEPLTRTRGLKLATGAPCWNSWRVSETAPDLRCDSEEPYLVPLAVTSTRRLRELCHCLSLT